MLDKRSLVLLVGSNPLPNYLAAATLRPSRVRLVYTEQTAPTKDRLRDALRMRLGIDAVDETKVDDAGSAREVSIACRGLFGDAHLNYTGGTKVMAVTARRAFLAQGGLDHNASYVDEATGNLRFDDDSAPRSLITDTFDLDALLALHGYERKVPSAPPPHDPTPVDIAAMADTCFRDPTICDALYRRLTRENDEKHRRKPASYLRENPLTEVTLSGPVPGPDWSTAQIERWTDFLRGTWLEHFVAQVVGVVLGSEAAVHVSVKLHVPGRDPELDVVVIRGHRLYLLSCTTDRTAHLCKSKLFEATLRARQTGGDLARNALVSMLSGDDVGKVATDVRASWGETNTPRVFGLDDLRAWRTGERDDFVAWLRA